MGRRGSLGLTWLRGVAGVACVGLAFVVFAERTGHDDGVTTTEAAGLPDTVALSPVLPEASAPQRTIMIEAVRPKPEIVASEPPVLRSATLAFTGDTLVHSPIVERAHRNAGGAGFDFGPMFARVAPMLSGADAAICHLETPVAPPGEALSTAPVYGVPFEIAPALAAAGYDRCSTASNHTMDRRAAGIDATVGALEAAGLSQAGMARSPEEALGTFIGVNGFVVSHLSYTYGLNGFHRPDDEPWRTNLIEDGRIIEDARQARASGADIVIVSLHWGTERAATVTPYQRDVATLLTASGQIDLIVGHHAHVVQPIEQVNGVWVVYGMGNFLSNLPTGDSWPASSQDGVIVDVTFTEQAGGGVSVGQLSVIPTWVDRSNGWVIRPVVADLADPTVSDSTKAQLLHSMERTTTVVGPFIQG